MTHIMANFYHDGKEIQVMYPFDTKEQMYEFKHKIDELFKRKDETIQSKTLDISSH
jgi:hypothetical protein